MVFIFYKYKFFLDLVNVYLLDNKLYIFILYFLNTLSILYS